MTAIAVAELTVDAPRDVAFAKFVDFAHWDLWMPADFRPVRGPARALRMGDKPKVALGPGGRLVITLEVIRIRKDKEICWRGGAAALLQGEHSFLFAEAEPAPDGSARTRIRSEELFRGLLSAGPMAARVERLAADGASAMLTRFAQYLATGQVVA